VLDVFVLRIVDIGSWGPGVCVRRTCNCFWLLQLVPFSPCLTLHIQACHFPSLNLCFYCLLLSLFLTFRSLSSYTALVLSFFFSLNIGYSEDLLDCGTVLSQGVYPRKTTEESRAHVEPSIVVFSHRPVRLKVVCQS
jgi:hypothetical protein